MKSPLTGSDMILKSEQRTAVIKGKEVTWEQHFYECIDTGEQFTTTELDEINLKNINEALTN